MHQVCTRHCQVWCWGQLERLRISPVLSNTVDVSGYLLCKRSFRTRSHVFASMSWAPDKSKTKINLQQDLSGSRCLFLLQLGSVDDVASFDSANRDIDQSLQWDHRCSRFETKSFRVLLSLKRFLIPLWSTHRNTPFRSPIVLTESVFSCRSIVESSGDTKTRGQDSSFPRNKHSNLMQF